MSDPVKTITRCDFHDNGDVTVTFKVVLNHESGATFESKESAHVNNHDEAMAALISPSFLIGMKAHWEYYDLDGVNYYPEKAPIVEEPTEETEE